MLLTTAAAKYIDAESQDMITAKSPKTENLKGNNYS